MRGKYVRVTRSRSRTRLWDTPSSPTREVRPDDQPGVDEHRVRQPVARDAGEPSEHDGEDRGRDEWLQDRPGNAKEGLLVANAKVATGEHDG